MLNFDNVSRHSSSSLSLNLNIVLGCCVSSGEVIRVWWGEDAITGIPAVTVLSDFRIGVRQAAPSNVGIKFCPKFVPILSRTLSHSYTTGKWVILCGMFLIMRVTRFGYGRFGCVKCVGGSYKDMAMSAARLALRIKNITILKNETPSLPEVPGNFLLFLWNQHKQQRTELQERLALNYSPGY